MTSTYRDQPEFTSFITDLFHKWHDNEIEFVVLRNYESLPHSTNNDVDILVASRRFSDAERCLIGTATQQGWILIHRIHRVDFSPVGYWFIREGYSHTLHVDLFRNLSWRGVEILPADIVLSRRTKGELFDTPHRADEACLNLFSRLLYHGYVKDTYKPQIKKVFEQDRYTFVHTLEDILGQQLPSHIETAIAEENWTSIEARTNSIRRALWLRNLRKNPTMLLLQQVSDLRRLSRRIVFPPGFVLAIVGPDGVGKSQTLSQLSQEIAMSRLLPSISVRHWRPGIFPQLRTLTRKRTRTDEAGGPPRRTAGRFRWFRILYYWLDFAIGTLLKDRLDSSRLRLVIYDRCALDMAVDPVRYGLSSARGTRLLWRMIPKPDAVVLLYDDPERIYARKPELSVEEIDRQLGEWLRLAEEGEVDAIIRVDAPPEEIAKRVKEIIIEAFLEKNGVIGPKNDDIAWLNSILGQRTDPSAGSHNWRFGKLTLKDGRGYLIPLDSRRAAARALDVYPAQNRKSRLLKRGLAVGLRLGLAQPLLPKVWLAGHNEADQSVSPELFEHIKEILGRSDLCFGVSLGTPGTQQKPVIQAMTPDGQALAYVKIGWNPDITHLVTNEANTLRYLGEQNITAFDIPTVIHAGEWAGNHILVQSAPSLRGQPFSHTLMPEHLTVARTLANLGACEQALADSNWWSEFTTRVEQVTNYYYRSILDHCTQQVTDKAGNTVIPFHRCHGDFAPWNILTSGGRLYIFDWENSQPQAPPAWDLIRFQVQVLCLLKKCGPGQVVRSFQPGGDAYSALSAYLADLGLDSEWAERLFSLYMMV